MRRSSISFVPYEKKSSNDNKAELMGVFQHYGQKDNEGQVRLYKEHLKNSFKYLGALMPGYRAACALKYIDTDHSGYIKGDELDALIEYAYHSGYKA